MSEKNKSIAFSFGSQSFNVKRELSKRFKADKVNDIIKKTGPLKLRWTSKKENTLSLSIKAFNKLNLSKIEKEKYDSDHSLWLKFSLASSTILILLYFIFPSQLIEVVSRINII